MLYDLTSSIPKRHRLQITRILPLCPWIDPRDLPCIVLHKVPGLSFFLLGEPLSLALTTRAHVIVFAARFRLGKVVEMDGVDVVDAIGKLLGDFLK